MNDGLGNFLKEFERVASAIVDPYFVVDTDKTIVAFNRVFYAMLPRQVARGLKGKQIKDVIEFQLSDEDDIIDQCWRENRHVRLDEINGAVANDRQQRELRFILSATPVTSGKANIGALVILRNVTDEAEVQVKYQEMLESEARERDRLASQIRTRTKELLETNQLLLRTQKELLGYKRGLLV